MQVTLLFFAAARDAAGRSKEVVELPDSIGTIAEVTQWLGENYPLLGPQLGCLRIARNEEFVPLSSPIQLGDVLAVIPPVAGG